MATLRPRLPLSSVDALWPANSGAGRAASGIDISLIPQAKLLTVSIDDTAIRFVGFEGKRIVDWASVDMYGDDLTLPKRLRKYAGRFNRRLIDLPFYAPMVRFMEKPDVKRRYVDPVIRAETAATIPFEATEVDIAWTTLDDAKHPAVMATAVPKREVDAVIDLAHLAKVKPSAMYSKAAALALAAGVPNAVVAHLSRDAADFVLVRDDLAKTVHRVTIPGESDPEGSASIVAQAIDELTAFEVENAGLDGAKEIDNVVLTGTMTGSEPVLKAVRASLGSRIRSVSPRVWYPDGFPASLYAINVGLAIADWSLRSSSWRKSQGGRMRPADLLPERHRVRVLPKNSGRMAIASAAIAALLTTTIYGAGQARAGVESLEEAVTRLERQARLDAVQAARFNREQAEVASLSSQIEAIAAVKDTRQLGVDITIERLASMTTDSGIRRVNPTDITHSRGIVTIAATASSIAEALAYAESLRTSGLFTAVTVTDIAASAGPGGSGPLATLYSVSIDATYAFSDPTASSTRR